MRPPRVSVSGVVLNASDVFLVSSSALDFVSFDRNVCRAITLEKDGIASEKSR